MPVLLKKLLRVIWSTRGQFFSLVAVVCVGITVYISMNTAFYNLNRSKDIFYHDTNFADYYFHVIKAPQGVTRQIETIPGVVKATGRVSEDLAIFKANGDRATARLVGYPLPMKNEVNQLKLMDGRLFESYPPGGGIEILVDPQFAAANKLKPGDRITVIARGKKIPLTVVGTAITPEFVYNLKDAASIMPDPQSFGIFMIPQNQAQQILNYPGQINQVVISLVPGSDERLVANKVKKILDSYGNLASYPRKQQLSNAMLQGEIDGLKTSANTLPLIFLIIAAAIQFVMLSRIVRTQRLQIGIMKALGYSSPRIMLHYTEYALMVSCLGAALGTIFGLMMASVMSQMYMVYFNLPQAIGGVNQEAIVNGIILSLFIGTLSGLAASRGVTSLQPAEAMRSEPPKKVGKTFLEHWPWIWQKLTPSWKMSLRSANRNRGRFWITIIGIIFAVGLMVVAFFAQDAVNYMMERHFKVDQRYDYMLRFTTPVRETELLNISRLDGVLKAEPFFEVPTRLHFNGRSREDVLLGLPEGVTLKRLSGANNKELQLPEQGMLINQQTALKLGVKVGDTVSVETLLGFGPSRYTNLKVVGINESLVGGGSFVSLNEANRVLLENGLISGAMLKVDPGQAAAIEEHIDDINGVASIMSREKEYENFKSAMGASLGSIAVIVVFAVILGFAIVYNSSTISFAERKFELGLLRVIGFTTDEVAGLTWKEIMMQSILGIALGLPFGRLMSVAIIKANSTDLYSIPLIITPRTYMIAAVGGIVFIALAHRFAVRGIKRLDLVELMKNQD